MGMVSRIMGTLSQCSTWSWVPNLGWQESKCATDNDKRKNQVQELKFLPIFQMLLRPPIKRGKESQYTTSKNVSIEEKQAQFT